MKKYGGGFLVPSCNTVAWKGYNFQEHRANIIAALNNQVARCLRRPIRAVAIINNDA